MLNKGNKGKAQVEAEFHEDSEGNVRYWINASSSTGQEKKKKAASDVLLNKQKENVL